MIQKFMKKMNKNKKGFTLVELMVVVVIIGILVAIAVPVYNGVQNTARNNAIEANVRILNGAVSTYTADNQVTTLSAIDIDATNFSTSVLSTYLKSWPVGPGTTTYTIVDGVAQSH